ncbi:uncharacterized protein LOC132032177 [Lycium ferocissimum]|uniref:uncharacterized protein LOC132032177 n=1 Tax=Lycium ferocissimum TaxID=112874 RepID=UPI00281676C6|nr:uncharacterized protein LOC132032177 [Lycium ferocissimum]
METPDNMSATSPYVNLVSDDENMEATSEKNRQWDDRMALATARMKEAVQTTYAANEKMKEVETLLAYVEELTKKHPANQIGATFQTPLRQNTTHVGNSSHQTSAFQTPAPATNTNAYQAPRATGAPAIHRVQPNVTFQDHVTHIDSLPELENMEMFFEARIDKIEKEMGKKIAELEHGSKKKEGLRYSDLCIHPDLGLPEGFKIPKFDHFNGSSNPRANLRSYCDQLVGNGENEALLIRLFSRSLSATAMEWFISQDIS